MIRKEVANYFGHFERQDEIAGKIWKDPVFSPTSAFFFVWLVGFGLGFFAWLVFGVSCCLLTFLLTFLAVVL